MGNKKQLDGEMPEREKWTGKLDFILSCIGFAVGLGNVWRFPYLCFKNGGGAFLIPYVIMLTFAGLPLFLFELCLGQFASLGPITTFAKIAPMFKGIGIAMIVISAMVCVYYNMIIAYSLFYLFMSMRSEVPWATCGNEWNTPACTIRRADMNMSAPYNVTIGGTLLGTVEYGHKCNKTLLNSTMYSSVFSSQSQLSQFMTAEGCMLKAKTASEEFFENYVLDLSDSFDNFGYPRWQLVVALLVAWSLVYICLCRGVLSSGKVVYFTALFPYVTLIILMIRGATLENSLEGVKFYIIPDFEKLKDIKVWVSAAVQIFYSLGPAWGGLLTMSSFNDFKNNCYRDAIIVAVVNCGTSVFAGFVIFSMLGYMSHITGLPVEDVAASGPGLAFVAYPEGIASMPVAPLWACIFFFMLVLLGLDSQFVMLETVTSAIVDEFPVLRKKKWLFTLFVCLIMFLLGLPLCCPGGQYLLTLMDWYTASFSLLIVAFCELAVVCYIYGIHRFLLDIEMMLGFKPNIYWIVNWVFITPCAVLGILVSFGVQYSPASYGDYEFPFYAEMMGFGMIVVAAMFIPIFMIVEPFNVAGGCAFCKRITSPVPEWGPADDQYRTGDRYQPLENGFAMPTSGEKYMEQPMDYESGSYNQGYTEDVEPAQINGKF